MQFANFDYDIGYTQFLDQHGHIRQSLPDFAGDRAHLLSLYRYLVLTRVFDKKAVSLQRTGKLGTYASAYGQEAIGVGIGDAMRREDVLLPAYREYGAQIQRGVALSDILLYWGGDERGMCYAVPVQDFPICVPVASQAPHAVGVAYAMQYRKEPRVAVCVLGDGATSKGDFYEALNAAGVWGLPLVCVINNNQWAISVPRSAQSRAETLAQKAIAAGIAGEQVDGNDVIAVRDRIGRALDKARRGDGPTLLEALTYRLCDHTTADDARRYRSAEEVETQLQYDPIKRMRCLLESEYGWREGDDQNLHAQCLALVDEEVEKYLNTPPQPPASMFDFLYEKLPKAYAQQRAEVSREGGSDA